MGRHQPPGVFQPPTADGLAADQQRRLHALEQRPQDRLGGDRHCITCSTAAPLDGVVTTNPCAAWWGAIHLHMIVVHVVGGDGAVVDVKLRRNRETVLQYDDLVAGRHQFGVDARWAIGETLDATCSGTAARVTVELFTTGDADRGLVFSVDADETPPGG